MSSESKCPFAGGAGSHVVGGAPSNATWWPNQLTLKILRQHTKLPVLLKGVLHPDDAKKAAELGMDGLTVWGEPSDYFGTVELSYLAFARFTWDPALTWEQFIVGDLAPLLGGEARGNGQEGHATTKECVHGDEGSSVARAVAARWNPATAPAAASPSPSRCRPSRPMRGIFQCSLLIGHRNPLPNMKSAQ